MHQLARQSRGKSAIYYRPDYRIHVDKFAVAGGDGSLLHPYNTIQEGVDAVPEATDAPQSRTFYTIDIEAGDYDEDVTVDITGRRLRLHALGPVGLGVFEANTWQPSGTRRNLTIIGDADVVAGNVRSYFGIAAANDHGNRTGAVSSSFNAFRISGKLSIQSTHTSGTLESDIEAEVYGTDGGASGVSVENTADCKLTLDLYRSVFRGTVDLGINGKISQAIDTEFRSTATIKGFTRMVWCHFDDGIYTHENDNNNTETVKGILQSTFAGEFDGGDASPVLLLDRYTLQNFTLNGSTLGVGASTFLMDA